MRMKSQNGEKFYEAPEERHTLHDILQKYVWQYYIELEANPSVRATAEAHKALIEKINEAYLEDVDFSSWSSRIPKVDFYQGLFLQNIDFLTGIYSAEKKIDTKEKLREKILAVNNRYYKAKEAPAEKVPEKKEDKLFRGKYRWL